MNDDENETVSLDEEIPQATGATGKSHWFSRPLSLLATVMIVELILFIVVRAIILPLVVLEYSGGAQAEVLDLTYLVGFLSTAATLLLSILFYWLVRSAQKKAGDAPEVSWKTGASFWVGAGLALAYFVLYGLQSRDAFSQYPITAVMAYCTMLSSALSFALFFSLLAPVIEQKFGAIKGAVIIGAAFAVLSTVEFFVGKLYTNFTDVALGGMPAAALWTNLVTDILTGILTAFALAALRVALQRIASRRVPGAWMLFLCVPALVNMLYPVVVSALAGQNKIAVWVQLACIRFPFYLLVFTISLGILAGFRRWKTLGEFTAEAKALFLKARQTPVDASDEKEE